MVFHRLGVAVTALSFVLVMAAIQAAVAQSLAEIRGNAIAGTANTRAQFEQGESRAAQERVVAAIQHMKLLGEHAKNLSAQLAQLEEDILAAHADDSLIKQALADVAKAEQAYATAQRRVTESLAYKTAYERALHSSNKAQELPRVRKEFLDNDRDTQDAALERSAARKRLDAARQQVFMQDETYQQTVADLRSTKAELAQAEDEFERGLLALASANSTYRSAVAIRENAERAAAAARLIEASQRAAAKNQAKKNNNNNNSRNRRRR